MVVLAACGGGDRAPEFVGSASCVGCHAAEASAWRTSHHALAMQVANDSTLLGGWDRSREAGATPVYTFGVHPLQQVLLPLAGGRLQAYPVAWDARSKEGGGQRWYPLYADSLTRPGGPFHWTARDLTWNYQCAECHSTEVRKGYVAAADSYATTFTEVSVGCESCHGPGSDHARDPARRTTPLGGPAATWIFGIGDSIAHRSSPRTERREVETCGRCHARRGVTEEGFAYGKPLLASHRPSLLDAGLYWPDGQIRDEVYEYGSFLSSRMSHAGVTCSDCHDPHSAARPVGNATCAKCHLASTFDAPRHTHHAAGSPGAACVSCHMPSKVYMGVDVRHDHSFRLPRPDLTIALGVPNACAACHEAKGPHWAADRIASWTGRRRDPADHFGSAFARADQGDPTAGMPLIDIARDTTRPVMIRASALARVATVPTLPARAALALAATDPDPLIRYGVVRALDGFQSIDRIDPGVPLLTDTVRTIRIDAARALVEAREQLTATQREELDRGLVEWEAAQRLNDDRAEARTALGGLYGVQGKGAEAEQEYLAALRLDPAYAPAYVNLADLYRAAGRDAEGVKVLREGVARVPNDAALHHTLGLTLVRQRQLPEAVVELTRAVTLAPEDARFSYVLGVALYDTGDVVAAYHVVEAALTFHPYEANLLELKRTMTTPRR